jgi:hypothetical protein
MPRRPSGLDGPRLTYGGRTGAPIREPRRIAPGTVVLVVLAVLAAVLIVLAVQRGLTNLRELEPAGRTTAAATPASPTGGVSAGPSGTDASETAKAPVGANEAASRFVKAWLDRNPKTRAPALEPVTAPGLAEQLANVDPARIPRARAVGSPRAVSVSPYSATLRQRLSNGSTIVLELAADPEARYGWLVYLVSPGEGF